MEIMCTVIGVPGVRITFSPPNKKGTHRVPFLFGDKERRGFEGDRAEHSEVKTVRRTVSDKEGLM